MALGTCLMFGGTVEGGAGHLRLRHPINTWRRRPTFSSEHATMRHSRAIQSLTSHLPFAISMVRVAEMTALTSGVAVAALRGLPYGSAVASSVYPYIGVDGVSRSSMRNHTL